MIAASLLGALFAAPLQAQTATPATTVKVLPADSAVLLISAAGSIHSAPDKLTLTFLINGSGESDAAAKAQAATKAEQFRAAVIAQGVPASAITAASNPPQMGFVGNESFDPDDTSAASRVVAAMARRHMSAVAMRIRLDRMEMLARVQKVATDLGVRSMGSPVLELKDDSTAHRAAIADAVAKARADADTYAAAIGYRVVRITQIANQMPSQRATDDGSNFLRMMADTQMGELHDVETSAVVTISFIIAPR